MILVSLNDAMVVSMVTLVFSHFPAVALYCRKLLVAGEVILTSEQEANATVTLTG